MRENLGLAVAARCVTRPNRIADLARPPCLIALRQRGALFQHELMSLTGLLPSQLDEALHELAALGLVTADAFTAVRMISGTATDRRRAEKRRRSSPIAARIHRRAVGPLVAVSRVSLQKSTRQQAATSWAWQLLRRWGVVFRDLLERESAAPPWGRLVQVYRRLEARGEIRGGRFVAAWAASNMPCPKRSN